MIPRVIPCLLIADGGLVKTVRFEDPTYIGDPINTVRIFNEKQADEIVVLDIRATIDGRPPDENGIREIASEAFMPVGYGGGIRDLATATRLIQLGVEKVILNSIAVEDTTVVAQIADHLGSSTTVVSIDAVRRSDGSYEVMIGGGRTPTGLDVRAHAEQMARHGAGELILTSVHRDGMMTGYDHDLIAAVTAAVEIPVVASGGASTLEDMAAVVRESGAAAAAAGSLFVFHGRHRAVLVTYPSYEVRTELFAGR